MTTLANTLKTAFFMLLFTLLQSDPVMAQSAQDFSMQYDGELVWFDEFEGTGVPDASKWERQEYNRRPNDNGPDGWWSKEDSYLDGNGNLVIRVRKIDNKNSDDDSYDYSVGALRTKGKYEKLYGKFEIRCKLPTQAGWWVAFWMMLGDVGGVGNGSTDGVEVDIMEGFGWTDKINLALHWDGYGDEHQSTGRAVNPAGIQDGFHTYSFEWHPDIYIFYIDGVEKWRTTGDGVCNQPGYIKVTGEISTLDWAINEWWSEDPANAVYPDSFIVDYVRVYDLPVGIESQTAPQQFNLYPNPVKDHLSIREYPGQKDQADKISILNTSGQILRSFDKLALKKSIYIGDLSAGIYFLSIRLDETMEFLKFIKE